MCITIYTLYSCNCRYPKTVTPCPMMDTALDLVDHDGIPESDPRVQRLEDQCDDKAATRYETHTDTCEPCRAAIAAVGLQAWSVAREKRDREEDDRWFWEMEREDRAVMAREERRKKKMQKSKRGLRCKRMRRRSRRASVEVDALEGESVGEGDTVVEEKEGGGAKMGNVETAMGAMRFLRDDDLVDAASSSPPTGIQVGKGTTPTPEDDDVMIYQDASDDDDDDDDDAAAAAVNPGDLRNALREVLGSHGNMQGSHGKENIYDADDDMLDVQDSADAAGTSRSAAPSP